MTANMSPAGWLPVARFFEAEHYPAALLVGGVEAAGYRDDDENRWYRDGEGADLESVPILPTHFREVAG